MKGYFMKFVLSSLLAIFLFFGSLANVANAEEVFDLKSVHKFECT